MEDRLLELQPKRKSILWNYQEDGTASIVAISGEKIKELSKTFKDLAPEAGVTAQDGIGVTLNIVGTKIWENCDGVTTVKEIIDNLVEEYDVPYSELFQDLKEFLEYCDELDILDLNWRSML